MNLRKPGPYQYSAGSPWKLPKYFFGIGLDEIVVADRGVVVDIDDAGVGDHVLDGGARADIVAVDDGMDASGDRSGAGRPVRWWRRPFARCLRR